MDSIDTTQYKGLNYFLQDQLEEFPECMASGGEAKAPNPDYLVELRGCELVVKEWIKMKPNDVFSIYNSQKFSKFMKAKRDDQPKLQQFVCVMFKVS